MKPLLLTLLLTLSLTSGAWGATYYVATGGNGSAPTTDPTTNAYATAYGTIQAAFDGVDLAPGDIVEVCDPDGSGETYAEKVTWGANDAGDATAQVILRGRTGDTITINGATLTECIYIDGIDYVTVTNLAVANAAINIECNGDTDGIQCTYITSSGSTSADFWQDGLNSDLVLDAWIITQGADYSIVLFGGLGTEVLDPTVSNCTLTGQAGQTHTHCCYLRYISGLTFTDNEIGTSVAWTLNNSAVNKICYVKDNIGTATVSGNTVGANGIVNEGVAFWVEDSATVNLLNNIVTDQRGSAVNALDVTTITMNGDVIDDVQTAATISVAFGEGITNFTHTDVSITNGTAQGFYASSGTGTISGGNYSDNGSNGIYFSGTELTVSNDTLIDANGAKGIIVSSAANATITCIASNNNGDGIFEESTGTVQIVSSTTNNNTGDGGSSNSGGTTTFDSCLAYSNGSAGAGTSGDGITHHDGGDVIVRSCVLFGNWKSGAAITGTGNCEIYNSTCVGNYEATNAGNYGIWLNNSGNSTAKNNICSGNEYEIYITSTAATGGGTINVDNNCYDVDATYWPSGTDGFHYNGVDFNFADYKTASSQDATTINSNPKFWNAAAGDFRLRANSPCRDAGTDVSLTSDYRGRTVPLNGTPDIGAYEGRGRAMLPDGTFLGYQP